jgi:hypothetical protein
MALSVSDPIAAGKIAILKCIDNDSSPLFVTNCVGKASYMKTMSHIIDFVLRCFNLTNEDACIKINCIPSASIHTEEYLRFLKAICFNDWNKYAVERCLKSYTEIFAADSQLLA